MYTLSIVIPVYNERDNIRAELDAINSRVKNDFELLIIYDFDEDNTLPVINEMLDSMPQIKTVKNKYGRGVLGAIKTGLESASGKYVVITMADLSDPPEVINNMLDLAERESADVVCASRYMKGGKQIGGPFLKGLMSRTAGLTLYYFASLPTYLKWYFLAFKIKFLGGRYKNGAE